MKKEKVLIGIVAALIAVAIIYAAVYFIFLKGQQAISPSDSSLQLSPQTHSAVSFLILFGACTLIIGGIGFITGERESMHKNLTSEKKLKKLDDLSLVRLTHHAQREVYKGRHHEEILAKFKAEGWHSHTIKKVKKKLHIPK